MSRPTLVFVYNADSGFMNTLLDIGHKIVSPGTYNCGLCALTHSTFRMQGAWRTFVNRLEYPTAFLHRDEFHARYGMRDMKLPAVVLEQESKITPWIGPAEIDQCNSLDEFEALVREKVRQIRDQH